MQGCGNQQREVGMVVAEMAWPGHGMVLGWVGLAFSCPDVLSVMSGGGVTWGLGLWSIGCMSAWWSPFG